MPSPVSWEDIQTASGGAMGITAEGQIVADEKYVEDLSLFLLDLGRFAYKAQQMKNAALEPEEAPLIDFTAPSYSTPIYDSEAGYYTARAVVTLSRTSILTIN